MTQVSLSFFDFFPELLCELLLDKELGTDEDGGADEGVEDSSPSSFGFRASALNTTCRIVEKISSTLVLSLAETSIAVQSSNCFAHSVASFCVTTRLSSKSVLFPTITHGNWSQKSTQKEVERKRSRGRGEIDLRTLFPSLSVTSSISFLRSLRCSKLERSDTLYTRMNP